MPWSGSAGSKTYGRSNGVYTGTQVWQQDSGAGTKITSPLHDTHDQDLATAINQTLMKDGGNAMTGDIPAGGNKFTNVGNAAALSQWVSGTQAQNGSFIYVPTVGGTADVLTLTTGWTLAAYVAGQKFRFINSGGPNTGAATINVDTLGAKAIVRNDGSYTALSAGDMPDNGLVEIVYDGTRFILVAGSGYVPGGADVAVADGGTGASTASGARTNLGLGTMAVQDASAVNISGGGITGITDLAVADGGTGASSASAARTNLGVPYASQANMEAAAGSVVVTPDVQHNHPGHPKFWLYATVSGGTPTLQTSYNVTSITDTAPGRMTVTIATDFSSANWACIMSVQEDGSTNSSVGQFTGVIENGSVAAGSILLHCGTTGQTGGGANTDPQSWSAAGFGDQ